MKFAVLCALVVGGLLAVDVQAATGLINVDFNSGANHAGDGTTATGAAAIGTAGDQWNGMAGASATAASLVDSSGASTAVTLDYTSGSSWDFTDGNRSPNPALTNEFLLTNPGAVTLKNVPAGQYDVYLYSVDDANGTRVTSFSINGGPAHTVLQQANASAWVEDDTSQGGNYTRFASVSPVGGVLDISYNGSINGFQLQSVPEPASLSLLAMGAGSLLLRRRR